MYPKSRATNLEVAETRRVLKLIRPFLPALARWNEQLPRHLAILASPRVPASDKDAACSGIEDMLAEVRKALAAFCEATASASSHSRVEDVQFSMSRVEARLAAVAAALDRVAPKPASIQRALLRTDEQVVETAESALTWQRWPEPSMTKLVSWVDGWEVHRRDDHGYGVYDQHGLIAGPFGTEAAAIRAALYLPKRPQVRHGKDVTTHLIVHS